MKKLFLVVCILAGFCASGPAHSVELVANGGFEEASNETLLSRLSAKVRRFYDGAADSPFAGWAFGGRWEKGDYAVAVSGQSHTGQRSCQITCLKRGRAGIASVPISLKSGSIIEVSFWLKTAEAGGGRIFLNLEGTPGDGWSSKELPTGTYDWRRFTARIVVPASQTVESQTIVAFLYTTCAGSIWIDDFSIKLVDANAPVDALGETAPLQKQPRPIPEPADSKGYRVNVVSPLEKVFRADDFMAVTKSGVEVASARNEYESMQVVVESPWRPVTIKQVEISDLRAPNGAVIPSDAAKWERVEFIETTVQPPYYIERGLGHYPDPLMPAGPFTVDKLSRVPLWITLKTPKECPPSQYTGTITITPAGLKETTISVTLTVWDFALTDQTHLRTLTWLGGGVIREWYGHDWSPEGEKKQAQAMRNYEDFLLGHRLGPGGEVASHVEADKDGNFDFRLVDATLQRLISKGMNAFIMGTAPNLGRINKKEYTPEFTQPSMSAKGECLDNAVAESFFGTLKAELLADQPGCRFAGKTQAAWLVGDYIDNFYNSIRKHSALGNRCPIAFELAYQINTQ